jgi:hypothetical protein
MAGDALKKRNERKKDGQETQDHSRRETVYAETATRRPSEATNSLTRARLPSDSVALVLDWVESRVPAEAAATAALLAWVAEVLARAVEAEAAAEVVEAEAAAAEAEAEAEVAAADEGVTAAALEVTAGVVVVVVVWVHESVVVVVVVGGT